ncbi:hypothetical protein QOT17_002234 [Balamuthia mandrillaris]
MKKSLLPLAPRQRHALSAGAFRTPSSPLVVSRLGFLNLIAPASSSSSLRSLSAQQNPNQMRHFHSAIPPLRADIFEQASAQVEESIEKSKRELKQEQQKLAKQERKRLQREQEAESKSARVKRENLPAGRKKLKPLLDQIRGLAYSEAVLQLQFSPLKIAKSVLSTVEAARLKAEKRFGLNPDRLVLDEIFLTKGPLGHKKLDIKGRMRRGIIQQQTSHLTVNLKEVPYQPGERKLGRWARGVNKLERLSWRKRLEAAAQALNKSPLYLTVREVRQWEKDQGMELPVLRKYRYLEDASSSAEKEESKKKKQSIVSGDDILWRDPFLSAHSRR